MITYIPKLLTFSIASILSEFEERTENVLLALYFHLFCLRQLLVFGIHFHSGNPLKSKV